MYDMAVSQPYGFLYVDTRKQRFFSSFNHELMPVVLRQLPGGLDHH